MTNNINHSKPTVAIANISASIVLMQVCLMLLSWIITAAWPESSVRSMLSSDGIRWFFGTFSKNVFSVGFSWLFLLSIGVGACKSSGLCRGVRSFRKLDYRERAALRFVFAELFIMVSSVCILAFFPHAVLLGVAGQLFPSSFSEGLVPAIAFMMVACSLTYGMAVGQLASVSDCFMSLLYGIKNFSSLFVLYILLSEFYCSICYVFII